MLIDQTDKRCLALLKMVFWNVEILRLNFKIKMVQNISQMMKSAALDLNKKQTLFQSCQVLEQLYIWKKIAAKFRYQNLKSNIRVAKNHTENNLMAIFLQT